MAEWDRRSSWHACHVDGFALPGADEVYPPDLQLSPIHLDIALRFDIPARRADGEVTTTVKAAAAGEHTLTLHAVDFEDVVVIDPDGGALSWRYDGEAFRIRWDKAFADDETRKVTITYTLQDPVTGLYFASPEGDDDPGAPTFAGTDNETERARHWLPCLDLPSARPSLDIRLTGDAALTMLANGELVGEEDHGDGTKTAHWRLEQPCPSYLTCVAVGDFARFDQDPVRDVPIAFFATRPVTPEQLELTFGRTREMLEWIEGKLGQPYPYPKYYQIALPGIGGAMENISLVTWDALRFILDETLATEWGRLIDQINIHEMAHSWFGDLVVCRDFAHAWLKESWASYMEQCWLEHAHGLDEHQLEFLLASRSYFREVKQRYKRPIVTRRFSSSWDMYDMHLYPGGACRLHTLRHELGDEVFWEAVRDYVRTYAFRVVETDDFRRIMERHSGRSLGRFFDQWLRSPGYPALKVAFDYDAKKGLGTFEVEQTQVDEEAGVPAFELSLDLGWAADGEDAYRTTRVRLTRERQLFVVPMESSPAQVRLDPGAKVLFELDFNPGEDRLRAQLTGAPDVIGRVLAGEELAKTGKRKHAQWVRDAWDGESFWGVRMLWADALGASGSQAAAEILAELVELETDPQVLEPLMRAAGKLRDTAVAQAIVRRLKTGDLPYRATMAAYEALGSQRDAQYLPLLTRAAKVEGYGSFAQSGALRGLGRSRQPEALEPLLDSVQAGAAPTIARQAAIDALAEAGRFSERPERARAADALVDLLRDANERVRRTAVGGLEAIGEVSAVEALESYARRVPAQERAGIERALAAIRQGVAPREKALEGQLEELRGRMRKLQDQVDRLAARVDGAGSGGSEDGDG